MERAEMIALAGLGYVGFRTSCRDVQVENMHSRHGYAGFGIRGGFARYS
jgi:hypothetical protein